MYPNSVKCALKGIEAVNPRELVTSALRVSPLPGDGNVCVISIGKAAETMALGACDTLGDRVVEGVVIGPEKEAKLPPQLQVFKGGHPIPQSEGQEGANAIIQLLSGDNSDKQILCLISGGASALSMCPADGISLDDTMAVTRLLLRSGATIDELNCVRKHIDRLKGGRLARLAAPATVTTLILSDVIGDPLDTIASGPTVADPSTFDRAIEILKDRGLWEEIPASVRDHLLAKEDESAKPGDSFFANVTTAIIGNNERAAEAVKVEAELMGYSTQIVTTSLAGEARVRGTEIARQALEMKKANPGKKMALVYAGEPTVTVKGSGRGGRNQELVLAAAIEIQGVEGISITSLGTDGIDGPTDAAGAFCDGETISRAAQKNLNYEKELENNNAYHFFDTVGSLVITGPTGTNVMDVVVVTLE